MCERLKDKSLFMKTAIYIYGFFFCSSMVECYLKRPKESSCVGFIAHPTRAVSLYVNILIQFLHIFYEKGEIL